MLKLMPIFVGLRYILAKKDNRFISFTSLISMAGLTLGVFALIIVLSVFNGSQGVMRDRTLITVPHGDIYSNGAMPDWRSEARLLTSQPHIQGVSPYTKAEAMLSQHDYHQVTEIKGILPAAEMQVSTIENNMLQGSLLDLMPGEHGIILGRSLAGSLRLSRGDSVNLIVPEVGKSSRSIKTNIHRFNVVGVFDVRFNIGSNLALIHISDSQALLGVDQLDEAVRLRLKVDDIYEAANIVHNSVQLLNATYPAVEHSGEDWSISEASLFNALKMEKIMTWFMLMMIVAIGAFNIISTLVMVVSDKQADIAILRTMGAGQRTIMGIFMVQGVIVGVSGTLIGAVLGLSIAYNFSSIADFFESVFVPDDLYLISTLPAQVQMQDVLVTCACALVISFLATLYPAWKASRIMPAEVLRYE